MFAGMEQAMDLIEQHAQAFAIRLMGYVAATDTGVQQVLQSLGQLGDLGAAVLFARDLRHLLSKAGQQAKGFMTPSDINQLLPQVFHPLEMLRQAGELLFRGRCTLDHKLVLCTETLSVTVQ